MPWTPADAPRKTRKAKTAAQRRQWADVANSVLKRLGAKGVKGKRAEAAAIIQANGVLGGPSKTRKRK